METGPGVLKTTVGEGSVELRPSPKSQWYDSALPVLVFVSFTVAGAHCETGATV